MKVLRRRMGTFALGMLCMAMAVGMFLGTGFRSRAEVQTGKVEGTNGAITWSYDTETKTITITGTGRRVYPSNGDTSSSPLPIEAQKLVFQDCKISGSMRFLLDGMKNLTAVDFSGLDTSEVTSMALMFNGCSHLESLDLSRFHTSAVTDMSAMFYGCSGLTSLDLSSFDTGAVTSMSFMFCGCFGLTSLDVSSFDTRAVTSMRSMFYDCSGLTSLDVSSFDTGAVTTMDAMFYGCSGLTSLDLSSFDTGAVTTMGHMFYGCSGLTSLDVSHFDTSAVTSMGYMFCVCPGLTSLDLSSFDTRAVTDMSSMFYWCTGLTSLDVSGFDTGAVTDMSSMFYWCPGLTGLDLSSFDTGAVKNMKYMFYWCTGLTSLDLSGFDTRAVTTMGKMFSGCSSLTSLNLSNFDTRAVTDMRSMFKCCGKLAVLNLSNFDMSKVENSEDFLGDCEKLRILMAPLGIKAEIILPGDLKQWTREDTGEMVTTLPLGLTQSVKLYDAAYQPSLADVKETGWEYPFVQYVIIRGLMNGKGTDDEGNIKFDPNGNLTRAEFARVLYNMEGCPAVTFENFFSDVAAGTWYSDAVIWAKQNNIVAGKNGIFDVNGRITREEMATMFKKYAVYKGYSDSLNNLADISAYEDVNEISKWAVENLRWAIGNNIMKGKGTKIDPLGKATRAECAAMLKNFCENFGL